MLHYIKLFQTYPKNDDGMLGWVLLKKVTKGNGASREDDFVCLDLGIITGESDIEEVFLLAEFSEGDADVGLEVVPPQAELFRGHLGTLTVDLIG